MGPIPPIVSHFRRVWAAASLQAVSMFPGGRLQLRIGQRLTALLGSTLVVGAYLFGSHGKRDTSAHVRYAPQDWAHAACREHLREASNENKRKAFDEICEISDGYMELI